MLVAKEIAPRCEQVCEHACLVLRDGPAWTAQRSQYGLRIQCDPEQNKALTENNETFLQD